MGSLARKLTRAISQSYKTPEEYRRAVIKRIKAARELIKKKALPGWEKTALTSWLKSICGTKGYTGNGKWCDKGIIYGQQGQVFNTTPEHKPFQDRYRNKPLPIYKPVIEGKKMVFSSGDVYDITPAGNITRARN